MLRLHPVTQLIILAIALRLTADVILFANSFKAYAQFGPESGDTGWYWSRLFASNEREIAQTIVYVVDGVMIEGLSRTWRALRERRLAGIGMEA